MLLTLLFRYGPYEYLFCRKQHLTTTLLTIVTTPTFSWQSASLNLSSCMFSLSIWFTNRFWMEQSFWSRNFLFVLVLLCSITWLLKNDFCYYFVRFLFLLYLSSCECQIKYFMNSKIFFCFLNPYLNINLKYEISNFWRSI